MSTTLPPFPAAKPRPRIWWFAVGVLLLLAAGAAFLWFLFQAIDGFADVDGRVPADGAPHLVDVAAEEQMFLWVQEYDAADCLIRDRARGVDIDVQPISGTFSRSESPAQDSWIATGRFGSGSGRLSVTCSEAGGPAEIGPAVDVGSFVVSLLLAILLPLLLGGAGMTVLILTGVLWATRPSRSG